MDRSVIRALLTPLFIKDCDFRPNPEYFKNINKANEFMGLPPAYISNYKIRNIIKDNIPNYFSEYSSHKIKKKEENYGRI